MPDEFNFSCLASDSGQGREGAGPVGTKAREHGKEYCTMKLDILIVKTAFVMYEGSSNMVNNCCMVEV